MSITAPPPMRHDLVVGGAGPAGLATAIEAQQRGLRVLVLEQRGELQATPGAQPYGSRLNVVRLRRSSVAAAARWQAAGSLFDGREATRWPVPVARIGHVERTLLERARDAGVEVRLGAPVDDVFSGPAGLTHVRSGGVEHAAPLYVEARGRSGSAPLRDDLRIRTRTLPGGSRLATVQLPPQPDRAPAATSWRARFDGLRIPHFRYGTADGSTLTVRVRADATPRQAMAAVRHVMRTHELVGSADRMQVVDARPTTVSRTAVPGIALVGDAAGTVHPITGQGLNQGLRDARHAARLAARLHAGMPAPLAYGLYRAPVGASHAWHAAVSSAIALPPRIHAVWMGAALLAAFAVERP